MGLARKGSRTLRIGDIDYRWVVSADSGFMTIVVELESPSGRRLEAQVLYGDERADGQRRVTPAVVRRVIELALRDGWDPTSSGPPFVLADADQRVWCDL